MPDLGRDTLPTTMTDGWNRIGSDTSSIRGEQPSFKDRVRDWQERVGHVIESRRAHLFVLFLLIVDVSCVIADLSYSFLSSQQCEDDNTHEPTWLTVLSHISLGITTVFLVEIVLALFAFGPSYYNPFGKIFLATLHLFDAIVIITSFVLEIVLRGREEELAALLIILRFWRIVKLMEGVAVGAGELSAETMEEFEATKERLLQVQDEVQRLRQCLVVAGIDPDDPESEIQNSNLSS